MVGRLVSVAGIIAVLALGPASAHAVAEADPGPGAACLPTLVRHLGLACQRPDGLFDVVLADGLRLTTHGPDPFLPAAMDVFAAAGAEREPVCATEHYIHVLYGYPGGSRLESVADPIRSHMRRMNALLNTEALDSGGVTADYKVRCDGEGRIQVDGFAGPQTGGDYITEYSAIVTAARGAGFTEESVDYLIFYDAGSTVCGVANLSGDDRPVANNANVVETGYGVVYDGCWEGRTPMHENGHTQGAVQDLAPDWDLTGHCLEGEDVMCYPTSSILVLCGDRAHYDCDNDTYFDAEPEDGEYLSSHWNIGSRINPFIAFDAEPPAPEAPAKNLTVAPPAPPPAPPPPPTPSPTPPAPPPAPPTPPATAVADLGELPPLEAPAEESPTVAVPAILALLALGAILRRR